MAPELHAGRPADALSDQFAFCMSLYESLHGRRAFSGATADEYVAAVRGGPTAARPGRGAARDRSGAGDRAVGGSGAALRVARRASRRARARARSTAAAAGLGSGGRRGGVARRRRDRGDGFASSACARACDAASFIAAAAPGASCAVRRAAGAARRTVAADRSRQAPAPVRARLAVAEPVAPITDRPRERRSAAAALHGRHRSRGSRRSCLPHRSRLVARGRVAARAGGACAAPARDLRDAARPVPGGASPARPLDGADVARAIMLGNCPAGSFATDRGSLAGGDDPGGRGALRGQPGHAPPRAEADPAASDRDSRAARLLARSDRGTRLQPAARDAGACLSGAGRGLSRRRRLRRRRGARRGAERGEVSKRGIRAPAIRRCAAARPAPPTSITRVPPPAPRPNAVVSRADQFSSRISDTAAIDVGVLSASGLISEDSGNSTGCS